MTDTEHEAALARLQEFADQQRGADELADNGSMDRAADLMLLYEARDEEGQRRWVKDLPAPKATRHRGRPVDPESFSRFTRWVRDVKGVKLGGVYQYRLRDAHQIAANYFASGKLNSEAAARPLKWLIKHEYADQIPDVWRHAEELASGTSPDQSTVRRALADWKKDHLPKAERPAGTKRGGRALVDRWLRDWHRIMEEYPEYAIDAINRAETEAEQHFVKEEAVA